MRLPFRPRPEAPTSDRPRTIGFVDRAPAAGRRVLLTAFDDDPAAAEALLVGVARGYVRRGDRPVLVGVGCDPRFVARHPDPVEMLPRRQDLAGFSREEFDTYIQARWDNLLAKWRPILQVDLGKEFDRFF
ncbi:hypothetical protein DXV76_05785 [Rhodobacteraceae bacterium CCMM004]|nr:hypothetical protein DXV76_05785 [Rhodobacteraceae bacterium CCMM004]